MILERIQKENDIKELSDEELKILASEIRQFLIEKISDTGGHLASNLGVIELTMALHLFLDLPKDKLIWDVGHQSYTHKLLTGRKEGFDQLRKYGGTSALIEGAMLTGAVLAGATQGEQKIIEQTAGEVGLAFQIQDDILDATSTMEVLGKPIGSDEKNHKITYVTYEGIEKAKADVASLSEQAIARMDSLVVKNEYLTELLRYLILREK